MQCKKILVPVDFSPSSKRALEWALAFAERFDAQVMVVHTWEIPSYLRPDLTVWSGDISATLTDYTRADAEKNMQTFLRETRAGERANVSSSVEPGAPYPTILRLASERAIDLIAMGTHGRAGVAHLLLGSTAENVVRHATCPVLTVRAEEVKT
jgi:universal stress protein A